MRISPISFGKAVRVIGPKETAFDIVRLVNDKKVSNLERVAQKQAQAIFDDATSKAPARVVVYPSAYGNYEKAFIVSGEERKKADKIYENMVEDILQSQDQQSETNNYYNIIGEHKADLLEMLFDSQENFEISAVYNEKNTAIKSINKNYAGIYAVVGTPKQVSELKEILEGSEGRVLFFNATSMYKKGKTDGLLAECAKQEKEVYFVVAGKKMTDNVIYMEHGFSTVNGISQKIERFVELDNVKEQAKSIQESMKH